MYRSDFRAGHILVISLCISPTFVQSRPFSPTRFVRTYFYSVILIPNGTVVTPRQAREPSFRLETAA